MSSAQIAELALWFPAFLLSITIHEAAHAWAGVRGGDFTAEEQATLNPTPHIRQEPVGTLVAPVLSFFLMGGVCLGWASAPYDPLWAQRHPRRAALMSLASPLANFLLAGIALGLIHILLSTGTFKPLASVKEISLVVAPGSEGLKFLAKILSIVFVLNVILGVFNLIPFPPLDGAGVLSGLFPRTALSRLIERLEEGGWSFLGLLGAIAIFYAIGADLIAYAINYGVYGGKMVLGG